MSSEGGYGSDPLPLYDAVSTVDDREAVHHSSAR